MAETYRKQMIVGTSLCGADGRMNIPSTFAVFQDIASEHAEKLGLGFEPMAEKQTFWVVVRSRVHFYHRPKLAAGIAVETWPLQHGKARCDRCYRMTEGEILLAEGRNEWCVVNTQTGAACSLEDVFSADIDYCQEKLLDAPYARFKHNFSEEDKACSYAVRTSDIDMGRHMNNVAYLRMLCDSFTVEELEAMNITEMEIMYLSSCFEGDVLDIMRRKTDFGYEFGVRRPDGRYAALALIKAE